MAEFTPFAGLRYNPEKVDLSNVIAPPYDVIKGDMRSQLVQRSEYNVVEIELPEGDGDSKYEAAGSIVQQWEAAGVLQRDDASFYAYEQEFAVPGANETKKRRGVLGALRLEEFGQGVQPHEHTLSGPKEDRLKLLRATHTNTSPIFGLYADNDGWVSSLLDVACSGEPVCEAIDNESVVHRVWLLDDDESVNAVVAALEDEPVLIADGHHRYETALNYRNERRAAAGDNWTGAELENYVMMMCVSTQDTGLIVLPTHRVVKGVSEDDIAKLQTTLAAYFDIEPLPTSADEIMQRVNDTSATSTRLAMHLKGQTYLLSLRPNGPHVEVMRNEQSDAYNALDVTILHTLILEQQFGIDAAALAAGGRVSYTIDAADAIAKVESGEYNAAFLLRPTPVEQVQEVAAAGDKMPQKSTYFYPKLATGLVLRPLEHEA